MKITKETNVKLKFTEPQKKIYNIFIMTLALIAVVMAFLDIVDKISIESNSTLHYIDTAILIIFTIDYLTRFILSENKKQFFKSNILDLIAIIPFNSMFRAFRITRITRVARLSRLSKLTKLSKLSRLVRLLAFSKRFTNNMSKFLKTNGFAYILYITIFTVFSGAVSIYLLEKGTTVETFEDAIWWSFVTTTTVGYGDISPTTVHGRIIASILMLVGIGFVGMLTGTIATFFLSKTPEHKTTELVIDISDLAENDREKVIDFIEFIRSKY
jgi:voltage-gated potassium channel